MISQKSGGLWSIFASYFIVAGLAYKLGGFTIVVPEILNFVYANIDSVKHNHFNFAMMIPVVLAVLAIDLPLSVAAGMLQNLLLGDPKGSHKMEDLMQCRWFQKWSRLNKVACRLRISLHETLVDMVGNRRAEQSLFKHFFILVLIEELFARELFLGLLHQIPQLNNSIGFYLLFFIGNGLWALTHLTNFKLYEDRHPLRVAPQFVSGVFFSYIYVKYGLTITLLTHFGANALLFATHKVQKTDDKDLILTGVSIIYAACSYASMRFPIKDTLQWLEEVPVFPIPGWELQDYVAFLVFVPTALASIFGILLYDRNGLENKKSDPVFEIKVRKWGCLAIPLGLLIAIFAYLGSIYGWFALGGYFIKNIHTRIIALSVIHCFREQGSSGSAVSRTFWTILPEMYVIICAVLAMEFKTALMAIPLAVMILFPWLLLQKWDD